MDKSRYNDEIDFIRSNYANTSVKDLADAIGRSETFVRKYAKKLGLKKSEDYLKNHKYKDANVRFIVFRGAEVEISGYGRDVAEYFGISVSQLTNAAQRRELLRGKYNVLYASDSKMIAYIKSHPSDITTETMDWPLWFFKSGMAPLYAKYYSHKHMPED